MISFHWSYLILVAGILAVPISVSIMDRHDDWGFGALFGGFLGIGLFLISVIAWLSIKHWGQP
jgi:hypothetical protein